MYLLILCKIHFFISFLTKDILFMFLRFKGISLKICGIKNWFNLFPYLLFHLGMIIRVEWKQKIFSDQNALGAKSCLLISRTHLNYFKFFGVYLHSPQQPWKFVILVKITKFWNFFILLSSSFHKLSLGAKSTLWK